MMPALIDTNLLVYLYDQRDPQRQDLARRVLSEVETLGIGRLSVQALAEFFSVVTRKLSPPLTAREALEQVTLLAQVWPVLDLTALIVLEAGRGTRDYGLAYYDAQMWATARLNQVPLILSENSQDGQVLEGIRFVNPFAPDFNLGAWL
jgi:predicted nucleic acid-binding protein